MAGREGVGKGKKAGLGRRERSKTSLGSVTMVSARYFLVEVYEYIALHNDHRDPCHRHIERGERALTQIQRGLYQPSDPHTRLCLRLRLAQLHRDISAGTSSASQLVVPPRPSSSIRKLKMSNPLSIVVCASPFVAWVCVS